MTGIVVGVDGSPSAQHAVSWAAREADLHGWPLRAVLAWNYLDQHYPSLAPRFDNDYSEQDARVALDAYVAQAFAPASPPTMLRTPICDLPARALIDSSRDASLLVVGAHGLGGFQELLLGSVSQHCLHHATCPVAIVRPDADVSQHAVERIVVGIDGSTTARRALEWALDEAIVRRAALEVVHTWHSPFTDGSRYHVVATDPREFEEGARAMVADSLVGLNTAGLDHPIEQTLQMDNPASAILRAAEHASLIVVGSRGRGGFAGLVLGSVSHHVSHHARCPVVIVPTVA